MAVLQAWHVQCGEPGPEEAIVVGPKRMRKDDVRDPRDIEHEPRRLATALREDLKAVGVTRSLLFEEEAPNVQELRFHDLRSTFCTWARREGKSDVWISERTGRDVEGDMISRYDRGAQTLGDLGYQPLPDITSAIPELAPVAPTATPPSPATGEETDVRATSLLATALAICSDEATKKCGTSAAESSAIPDTSELVGARGFEPPTPRSRTECATRLRYAPMP